MLCLIFIQSMTPKCPTFFNKKRWKSGTLWENLPKMYHFWTNKKKEKSGTLWGHRLYIGITFA